MQRARSSQNWGNANYKSVDENDTVPSSSSGRAFRRRRGRGRGFRRFGAASNDNQGQQHEHGFGSPDGMELKDLAASNAEPLAAGGGTNTSSQNNTTSNITPPPGRRRSQQQERPLLGYGPIPVQALVDLDTPPPLPTLSSTLISSNDSETPTPPGLTAGARPTPPDLTEEIIRRVRSSPERSPSKVSGESSPITLLEIAAASSPTVTMSRTKTNRQDKKPRQDSRGNGSSGKSANLDVSTRATPPRAPTPTRPQSHNLRTPSDSTSVVSPISWNSATTRSSHAPQESPLSKSVMRTPKSYSRLHQHMHHFQEGQATSSSLPQHLRGDIGTIIDPIQMGSPRPRGSPFQGSQSRGDHLEVIGGSSGSIGNISDTFNNSDDYFSASDSEDNASVKEPFSDQVKSLNKLLTSTKKRLGAFEYGSSSDWITDQDNDNLTKEEEDLEAVRRQLQEELSMVDLSILNDDISSTPFKTPSYRSSKRPHSDELSKRTMFDHDSKYSGTSSRNAQRERSPMALEWSRIDDESGDDLNNVPRITEPALRKERGDIEPKGKRQLYSEHDTIIVSPSKSLKSIDSGWGQEMSLSYDIEVPPPPSNRSKMNHGSYSKSMSKISSIEPMDFFAEENGLSKLDGSEKNGEASLPLQEVTVSDHNASMNPKSPFPIQHPEIFQKKAGIDPTLTLARQPRQLESRLNHSEKTPSNKESGKQFMPFRHSTKQDQGAPTEVHHLPNSQPAISQELLYDSSLESYPNLKGKHSSLDSSVPSIDSKDLQSPFSSNGHHANDLNTGSGYISSDQSNSSSIISISANVTRKGSNAPRPSYLEGSLVSPPIRATHSKYMETADQRSSPSQLLVSEAKDQYSIEQMEYSERINEFCPEPSTINEPQFRAKKSETNTGQSCLEENGKLFQSDVQRECHYSDAGVMNRKFDKPKVVRKLSREIEPPTQTLPYDYEHPQTNKRYTNSLFESPNSFLSENAAPPVSRENTKDVKPKLSPMPALRDNESEFDTPWDEYMMKDQHITQLSSDVVQSFEAEIDDTAVLQNRRTNPITVDDNVGKKRFLSPVQEKQHGVEKEKPFRNFFAGFLSKKKQSHKSQNDPFETPERKHKVRDDDNDWLLQTFDRSDNPKSYSLSPIIPNTDKGDGEEILVELAASPVGPLLFIESEDDSPISRQIRTKEDDMEAQTKDANHTPIALVQKRGKRLKVCICLSFLMVPIGVIILLSTFGIFRSNDSLQLESPMPSTSSNPTGFPTMTLMPSPMPPPTNEPSLEPTIQSISFESIYEIFVQDGLISDIPSSVYKGDLVLSMDNLLPRLVDNLPARSRKLIEPNLTILPSRIESFETISCATPDLRNRCEKVVAYITLQNAGDSWVDLKVSLDLAIAIGQLQFELDRVNPDSVVAIIDLIPDSLPTSQLSPAPSSLPLETTMPSLMPSVATETFAPSVIISESPVNSNLFAFLVENSFDNGEALSDVNSAQHKAFIWLLSNSGLQEYSEDRILQRYALATFFFNTNGEDWFTKTDWMSDSDECFWYSRSPRSSCNRDGAFENLELDYNNISGEIPPELGLLSDSLQIIVLRGGPTSFVSGTLPTELGFLTKMELFFIRNNRYSGSVPTELSQWTDLEQFDIAGNKFTGTIPARLLENAVELISFDVSDNILGGSIPTEVGNIRKCQRFFFENNMLSGVIPTEISNLRRLQSLRGGQNMITGLPSELGRLPALNTISFPDNNLMGRVPLELSSLPRLFIIDLSFNELTGVIPSELGSLLNMRDRIDLSHNRLTGQIPSELGNLNRLRGLFLQHNKLSGNIPSEFSSLVRATTINLQSNDLTGAIPFRVCEVFNNTLPAFTGDCSEFDDQAPCMTTCCADDEGCQCRYAGTPQEFLCFQQK